MKLEIVTAATEQPVTVAEVKRRSRITTSSDDTLIAGMIEVATSEAERQTWSKFITQTWDAYYDSFADLARLLPFPPCASITTVKYIDTDGDTQTVADTVYELGKALSVGLVRLKYDQQWPTDVRSHEDVVIVRFVCGYGAAATVPEPIKSAIAIHVGHEYDCRGGESVPAAFRNLLAGGEYDYSSFVSPFWGDA